MLRKLNRLLALLIGVALAGAGVLAGIETMLLILGRPSLVVPRGSWQSQIQGLSWGDTVLEVTCVGLIAVGAVVVLLQLVPRRPVRLALRAPTGRDRWVSRRGLVRRLTWEVGQLPQVSSDKVRVGRRRARIRVRLRPGFRAADTEALVRGAADHVLGALAPVRNVPVSVRLRETATSTAVRSDRV